jgi:hypothetical protein
MTRTHSLTLYVSPLLRRSISDGLKSLQQGIFRDPAPAPLGAGRGNDAYGASWILENGFNYAMADSLGTGTPLPLRYGQYTMVSMFYIKSRFDSSSFFHIMKPNAQRGHFGQGPTNYAGYTFPAEQFPGHPMNLGDSPLGANAASNNEGASSVWRLFNCWVGYAEEDELHLTIVFKRIPIPFA